MKGYVYILSNPSMPGIVKIGRTTRSVEGRAAELYQTGVPTPFVVKYSKLSPDCVALEKMAHEHFADKRICADREFFAIEVADAVLFIRDALLRQVYEFIDEFMPNCSLVPDDYAIDAYDLAEIGMKANVNPAQLVKAIPFLSAEAIQLAVSICKDAVTDPAVTADNNQNGGLLN